MPSSSSKAGTLPFALSAGGELTRQMADGIRSAIASGHWKPGDTLPSAARFRELLGTGGYVPRSALRLLADEGTVVLKRRVGAVVAPKRVTRTRGRVAFITDGQRESYYENVHAFVLQEQLGEAGWELVHVPTPRADGRSGGLGLDSLRRQLALGLDFAICFTESREIAAELDKARVRYVYEGGSGRTFPNALATINLELDSQDCFDRLASFWREGKVRKVLVVDFEHVMPRTLLGAFVKAGMTFRHLVVHCPKSRHYLQGIQQAGLHAIAKFFGVAGNRADPPDALFFYDDYLASGGLIALAATGIRVPEEMRVATLANRGLGPVWFKPLTRLEYDPVGNARLIGGYVLAILDGKDVPPPRLNMAFIPGET